MNYRHQLCILVFKDKLYINKLSAIFKLNVICTLNITRVKVFKYKLDTVVIGIHKTIHFSIRVVLSHLYKFERADDLTWTPVVANI